jgi:hypothetical protein
MARHPKTTRWMLIKVVRKKRYVRVEKVANGRYIPAVVGPYEPGSYYLRNNLLVVNGNLLKDRGSIAFVTLGWERCVI